MHDIFVVNHCNNHGYIKERFPHAQVIDPMLSRKELYTQISLLGVTEHAWVLDDRYDYTDFDLAYRPPWHQNEQLHVWPGVTQINGGDTILLNRREFLKQASELDAVQNYQSVAWKNQTVCTSTKPEIFVWGNGNANIDGAVVLRRIGSELDMMKRTLRKAKTNNIWIISDTCDYTDFNLDWRPGWEQEEYLHVWPTESQTKGGDTMYVNVAHARAQLDNIENLEHYDTIRWHSQPVKQKVKPLTVVWSRTGKDIGADISLRYIGSELDMMKRTLRKVNTPYFWIINDECSYTEFNFNWRPSWATQDYLHVWPTEHQTKGGDTMYVNTAQMIAQVELLERLEDYTVINWHSQPVKQKVKPLTVVWSRTGNAVEGADISLRYIGSELDMMKRTLRKVNTSSFWVITDECDYLNFDFNWRPSWATQDYLHVWPTESQTKGGDTMYVNTAQMIAQVVSLERLEDYTVIDWHKQSITQAYIPQIVAWSRNGTAVEGADITLRYLGSELDMMNRTLSKVSTPYFWVITDECDYTDFDFGYRPGWAKQSYLHVWPTEHQTKGGDTMYVNTAQMTAQLIELQELEHYDVIDWHTQHIAQKTKPQIVAWSRNGTAVEGADITLRYLGSELDMMNRTLRKVETSSFWVISDECNYLNFDFNWRPSWATQDYLHVWPTESQNKGGDTMYVNTAVMSEQVVSLERLEDYTVINWHTQRIAQKTKPLTVVWSRTGKDIGADISLRYLGSELDMMNRTLRKVNTSSFWVISDECDYTDFDFGYRPGWATQDYLHVWPTEHQTKGGDTMYVNTAVMSEQVVSLERLEDYTVIDWHTQHIAQKTKPQIVAWSRRGNTVEGADISLRYLGSELDMMNRTLSKVSTPYFWVISDTCDYTDFDFGYRPGWATQDYLHVWPTESQTKGGDTMYVNTAQMIAQLIELQELEHYDVIDWQQDCVKQTHTPEVFVWDATGNKDCFPGATVLRYVGDKYSMLEKTIRKATTPYIWILSSNNDYTNFDFNWRPSWATQNHLHVWPSGTQTHGGDTMYVNVAEFRKQALEIQALEQYVPINWHSTIVEQINKPDVIIWDGGDNTAYIKERFPDAKVMRNIGSRYDMMCRTMRHVDSNTAWVINSKCDYSQFDFDWRPGWANETQLHVWPTENQIKGGDTYYLDVREFKKQSLEITDLDQYNSVNWHTQSLRLQTTSDIVVWTFGGNEDNLNNIKTQYPNAKSLRYVGTHLEMVKKSAKYVNTDHFWVLSDCCDYIGFDANWRPDWETENSIQCWASGDQKFGDTFYVPTKQFLQEADNIDKLEYYSSIIWHSDGYSRLPWHINYIETGDIYSAITSHQFQNIYEYFVAPGSTLGSTVDPSLWEKRHLIAYNKNGHVSLCPRDAIGSISDRLSSYPYIQYHNCENSTQKVQDIVFISYDEKDADLNYELLLKRFPLAKRIHGVKGNVNAYKAAAKISNTPWYYAVFPKTKIDPDFGCNYHPNYLETPGHYIFNAHNVITNYAYGHGGVKMYHVKTTIEIENWGYDFTLSSPVTVVPVNSCYLVPASPYEAWRTSFREVLKLRDNTTVEGKYRLNRWLTGNHAEFGEYSIKGAEDALKFEGDVTIANSWEWLREQFNSRYK